MNLLSPRIPADEPAVRRSSLWPLQAVTAAFGAYFCMYAFRKPFTAAGFESAAQPDTDLKTWFVTAQVLGYALSKLIGVQFVSGLSRERRPLFLILLVAFAELALILFAVVPWPWTVVCMFLNGIPLGIVFGLVISFLEGRRLSEALAAGLCTSFILADGAVKSAGAWLMQQGISEYWMPATTGALFFLPYLISVILLSRTPEPDRGDVDERSQRSEMSMADRILLCRQLAWVLSLLMLLYLAVTIVRSIRADFAREIWAGLGVDAAPQTFSLSEMLVAAGVMIVTGCMSVIRDNRFAFRVSLLISLAGIGMLVSVLGIRLVSVQVSPLTFMVLTGLALYLPYVAAHTAIFERLLAMTRVRGNVGFLLYMADSIGYLGYITCLLFRHEIQQGTDVLSFFITLTWIASVVSFLCLAGSLAWERRR